MDRNATHPLCGLISVEVQCENRRGLLIFQKDPVVTLKDNNFGGNIVKLDFAVSEGLLLNCCPINAREKFISVQNVCSI